jgi:molecular chaperone DnaJ
MELPHERFTRSGNDLKITLPLTYPQLILGDKVEILTIEGSKIRITIPEYTKVGETLRIQNKGLKQINSNNRGDMIVYIDLVIPKEVSGEERKLIEELKKIT